MPNLNIAHWFKRKRKKSASGHELALAMLLIKVSGGDPTKRIIIGDKEI